MWSSSAGETWKPSSLITSHLAEHMAGAARAWYAIRRLRLLSEND